MPDTPATDRDAPASPLASDACVYCKKPADGTLHDIYGEFVMGGSLVVCVECDDDFQHEDGPWNEVR